MESPAAHSSITSKKNKPPRSGIFFHLQIILGVAFVLATLFTAWTPSELARQEIPGPLTFSGPAIPPTSTPFGAPTATPRPRPLIGIVSGHWGNDSGAVCADGLTEAEVNQSIATLVQKYLVEAGMDVDILREFDPKLAGYQASALVSIHNDSCSYINDQARGFKVAAALASPNPERATRLTSCLRARYGQITQLPLHSTSVTVDMTSYHAFDEIHPDTTAAIIETGFLYLDREYLTQETDEVAHGIADGVLCYIRNEDVTSPNSPPAEVSPTPTTTP